MDHLAFLSYSRADEAIASELRAALEEFGIRTWIDREGVMPGQHWGDAIAAAIRESQVVVPLISSHAVTSSWARAELQLADEHAIPIIPYRIEAVEPRPRDESVWRRFLDGIDALDGNTHEHARALAHAIRKVVPESFEYEIPVDSVDSQKKSKGYVFISYIKSDSDFVEELRQVLESRKYAYWDYVVGSRDYHGVLYRELEERIDGAAAFMTIVSDEWRNSDWVASEFIYAREAAIPIFVIEAKPLAKPLPILLNLQTRIDMSHDLDAGAGVLMEELAKKGL